MTDRKNISMIKFRTKGFKLTPKKFIQVFEGSFRKHIKVTENNISEKFMRLIIEPY